MKESLLSIIMPVYNPGKRLKVAVDCILMQNYRNIELILIDDGSTDGSSEICDTYSLQDNRVIIIHQENSGVSSARNTGIKQAQGKYIAFLDADDTVEMDTYTMAIEMLEKKTIDFVMFGMSEDYYRGYTYYHSKIISIKDMEFKKRNIKAYFMTLYNKEYLFSACTKVIRASIIKNNNLLFRNEMAMLEDLFFVLDVMEHSNNILVMHNVFYHYYKDISVSTYARRPKIDYIRNFQMLAARLRRFAVFADLISEEDQGKLNAMILSYYLIAIERLFDSNLGVIEKYNGLRQISFHIEVERVAEYAICDGKKLRITKPLFRKKCIKSLFILFWVYDLYQRGKRYLSRNIK